MTAPPRRSVPREGGRLPRPAQWLLRMSPLPREMRAEAEADLHELFARRRSDRGAGHAYWRLSRDIASLWLEMRPQAATDEGSSAFALVRDAGVDLRYAVRLFARQRGILALTVLGLSLGLGVATSAFSIMNAAALRGEGIVDSARAPGLLRTTDSSVSSVWTYDEFLRLREGSTRMRVEGVLTDAALAGTGPAGGAGPSVAVAFVSGGFFAATGGRTTLGRVLEAADERHVGPPPVVVSFVFWTSTLNQDPAVVGRAIRVGRSSATIVGVAERGFLAPSNCQLWMPLTAYGAVYEAAPVKGTPDAGVEVFGRLLPGVALAEAEAQLTGVASAFPKHATDGDSGLRVRLDPYAGLGRVSRMDALAVTALFLAVIALVLLLAWANVATVLVATAMTREREMGVRAALGASRRRILRQLVTESLALGAVAAAIGLLVTHWALPVIGAMLEAPAGTDFAPDLEVYLFLGIVTLLTGVGSGLAPAWHGRGTDLVTPLKGADSREGRVAPRRLRSLLVMTQAAVSVLMIVTATLFMRAAFRSATIDVGFETEGLYAVSPGVGDPFKQGGDAVKSFWARALPQLRDVPGIVSVALVEVTPFDGLTRTSFAGSEARRIVTYFNRTGSGYFETMGLRVLAGRTFTPGEVAARAPVAVISESVARTFWHERSPLGELMPPEIPIPPAIAMTPAGPALATPARPVVIGVVADAIMARLHERNPFTVYEPLDPPNEAFAQLMIRVAPGTTGAVNVASQRLRASDPQADVRIASVAARVQQEAGRPRMLAMLTGMVGMIAILLCVIGLYGLTASVVGQRSREMAVRAAIGAERSDLLRLLMWDSLRPVVFGLVIGAGAAWLASRVALAGFLFGVSPQDPIAFGGAAVILLAAAMLAVLVPTRRAAAVDAAAVLRGN